NNFSDWKAQFDDRMLAQLHKIAAERDNDPAILAHVSKVEELRNKIAAAKSETRRRLARELKSIWWVIHDLRRSARSLMTRAGVEPDHAERALGHIIPGVRGVYDRHHFRDEKRAAFEALATQVERIINPPAGNVVTLHSRQAASG